ncbi:NAD-dependent succinate-semialdehyde dehydrogenase [Paracoccus sp. SCSIO 75233]|uniref:NAD-dependent succinate-semialdehyde dehydrogenase n=1 Tax=Paracoccus sp. SCSIO 75233 TaxID=3017782 RepID=UPI0022EFEFD5|nr:NAD-dependent succinate-semialdehyde dehydrogenase [Paracoccus sp. SCSIO 75233]WBU52661.1 NAD-dependent succinate-semialdehyde dehydrogenase [Paracoccus sp. SCSIO 75233]
MLDDPKTDLAGQLADKDLLCSTGDFAGEGRLAVRDPATGNIVAKVTMSGASDARAAVDTAQHAFPGWSGMLPQDRAAILHRWHDLIIAAKEDLAKIMVAEQGKPVSEARGEIDYAASFVQFYAEEALRPNIEGITSHLPDAEMELWREPVGVAALITPWNFPCAMITRKAAAALGAGCTVVIHPSAETPLSALALTVLARRAGFPDGVYNTVIGDAATIVGEWTTDKRVRALSFTGSTEVGRLLYRQSADTVKRLVMELGGHAPFIVFQNADLDRAVSEGIKAKFATSGQDCLGANRFYIHRDIYDAFCARFTKAAQALSLGRGMDDPDIGPLIHDRQIEKQKAHVRDALDKGAKLLTGGEVEEKLGPLFFKPTVLADVPDDAAIMSEETFGPVAALTPFDSEDEVYRRANDSEYGLVAYVHSLDPRRIYRATRALQYGMVAVNRTKVTGAPIPFGGMKQSGIGREGARQGLEAFTEIKYVCRDWG